MTKEDEITRNLTLIEYYKEQLNAVDMQTQLMQAALADYHKAKITIEQLEKADKNSEILIPIGGGTFINGSIKDASKILVDIGAGVVTEKTVDDAIKKINERIENLQKNQEKLLSTAQKLQAESVELSQKTQKLIEETKK
ncbi:MAG: prefoldin subunit alpha [Thermoplasmatales archaeon]|nr:MAG: prefoldin subunit alpha [Thermoplasmatales archaeon]